MQPRGDRPRRPAQRASARPARARRLPSGRGARALPPRRRHAGARRPGRRRLLVRLRARLLPSPRRRSARRLGLGVRVVRDPRPGLRRRRSRGPAGAGHRTRRVARRDRRRLPPRPARSPSAPTPTTSSSAAGATLAGWADGRRPRSHLLVLTDGSKGTWDPDADVRRPRRAPAGTRHRATAARCSAPPTCTSCGCVDGELVSDIATRAWCAATIRARAARRRARSRSRGSSTGCTPITDHAGCSLIDGIVAARDPHFFPGSAACPTGPTHLLLFEAQSRRPLDLDTEARSTAKVEALLVPPQPVALHDGHRRSDPDVEAAAFAAELRQSRSPAARRRGLQAHHRSLSGPPAGNGGGGPDGLPPIVVDAEPLAALGRTLRGSPCASAACDASPEPCASPEPSSRCLALGRLPCRRLASRALRFAGAFLRCLLRVDAWPASVPSPSFAVLRFAGALLRGRRFAGAFFACASPEPSCAGAFRLAEPSASPEPCRFAGLPLRRRLLRRLLRRGAGFAALPTRSLCCLRSRCLLRCLGWRHFAEARSPPLLGMSSAGTG